ncbi:hypothetical protein BaRGS_00000916 [Batillaria attramentaria]|uniref:Uncharacterized protein n=1 Tax=Batillaria attramentaria TaxID=370345 RepID=A0ABD0M987_9CAEN
MHQLIQPAQLPTSSYLSPPKPPCFTSPTDQEDVGKPGEKGCIQPEGGESAKWRFRYLRGCKPHSVTVVLFVGLGAGRETKEGYTYGLCFFGEEAFSLVVAPEHHFSSPSTEKRLRPALTSS